MTGAAVAVTDNSGGPDIFLHATALEAAGIDPGSINRGDQLTFDVDSLVTEKSRRATSGRVKAKGKYNVREGTRDHRT